MSASTNDALQDWDWPESKPIDTEHAKKIARERLKRAPTFAEMKARLKEQIELRNYAKAIGVQE